MNLSAIPDAVFVLLSLYHPAFILVALIQYAARRHPFTARGFWLLLGCPAQSDVLAALLPGLVMSNDDDQEMVLSGSGTSSEAVPIAVLKQQYQSEPDIALKNLVTELAIMRRENGDYLFSSNEIRDK